MMQLERWPVRSSACLIGTLCAPYRQHMAFKRRALAGIAGAAILTVPGVTVAELPLLELRIREQQVEFGEVAMGESANEFFEIANPMSCDATFEMAGTSGSPFLTICSGLSNRDAIPAGDELSCKVTFTPRKPAVSKAKVEVTYGWGPQCREEEEQNIAAAFAPKEQAVQSSLDKLKDVGPELAPIEQERRAAELAYEEQKAELKGKIQQLEAGQPEVEELQREWLPRRTAHAERLSKHGELLNGLLAAGPNFHIVDGILETNRVRYTAERSKKESERAEDCARVPALMAEKERALDEMRKGYYCSRCNKSATRIVAETGDSFEAHLQKVQGERVPAAPEVIKQEAQHFDRKIAEAGQKCASYDAALARLDSDWVKTQEKSMQDRKLVQQQYDQRAATLQGLITKARKDWADEQATVEARIATAELAHRTALEKAKRELGLLDKRRSLQLEKFELEEKKARARHEDEIEKRERELNELRSAKQRALQALKQRMRRTERLSVTYTGTGRR